MTKRVCCTHCGESLEVGPRAISGVCPHCNKRVVIEDLRIQAYHAVRKLATCGDVLVDEGGHLVASVQAVNLTVRGKLSGDVRASGRVRISKTGSVAGNITAPSLLVESGAELWGRLHIGEKEKGAFYFLEPLS